LLGDEHHQKAVEVTESFADELICGADLSTAREAVKAGTFVANYYTFGTAYLAKKAVLETVAAEIHAVRDRVADERHIEGCSYQRDYTRLPRLEWGVIAEAANSAAEAVASSVADVEGLPKQIAEERRGVAKASEGQQQSHLLRCIFGNPFRSITLLPVILAWNDGTVVKLAQAAYEERHLPSGTLDTGRLAVLADALEEAGCTDTDILGHLRGPGPHVRGCWAVDPCLGKS
jgi:hypothetical protein